MEFENDGNEKRIEIWNMGILELGKLGIRNCGNWELWKSVIVEIGNMEIINFWNETKMLSSLLQVLPTWPLCREREREREMNTVGNCL